MSASEKLKVLEERWWKDHDEAHRMFYVLPQIRAVVEEAEFYLSEYTQGRPALTIGIEQSLAALDEVLP